jgi:hypothetical protein
VNVQKMNAEELYRRGVSLIKDINQCVESDRLAPLASAFLQAAMARKAIDTQDAVVAAMTPVPMFVPARDANGNNLYINQYASILSTTGEVDPDEWTQLYVRASA